MAGLDSCASRKRKVRRRRVRLPSRSYQRVASTSRTPLSRSSTVDAPDPQPCRRGGPERSGRTPSRHRPPRRRRSPRGPASRTRCRSPCPTDAARRGKCPRVAPGDASRRPGSIPGMIGSYSNQVGGASVDPSPNGRTTGVTLARSTRSARETALQVVTPAPRTFGRIAGRWGHVTPAPRTFGRNGASTAAARLSRVGTPLGYARRAARTIRNGAPPRVIRTPPTITNPPTTCPARIGSARKRNASTTASAGTRNW